MKNERGFTLLEMLLVMVVISALLLLIIPNIAQQRKTVESKGCDAIVRSAEGQVHAYYLEKNVFPSAEQLKDEGYIKTKDCPNGKTITVNTLDGTVTAK